MIEEKAEVVSIKSDYTLVTNTRTSTCKQCKSGSCSSKQLFSNNNDPHTMKVHNPVYAQPGDIVIVGIPEGALLKSAFIVYLLPLLLLIGLSSLGYYSFSIIGANPEIGSMLLGLAGLIIGIFITQNYNEYTQETAIMPMILRPAIPSVNPIHFEKQTSYT